jgi:hypothetical protein
MAGDTGRIEERLLYEVRGLKTEDVFTGASAIDLVLLVRRAAATMVAEDRTSDADLEQATEQLRIILAEMEVIRTELGLSEFHEITVGRAVAKLCPGFWPFC